MQYASVCNAQIEGNRISCAWRDQHWPCQSPVFGHSSPAASVLLSALRLTLGDSGSGESSESSSSMLRHVVELFCTEELLWFLLSKQLICTNSPTACWAWLVALPGTATTQLTVLTVSGTFWMSIAKPGGCLCCLDLGRLRELWTYDDN